MSKVSDDNQSESLAKLSSDVPTPSDSGDESTDKPIEPGKARFYHFQVKRPTDKTKGRIDAYIRTPEGTRLRSDRELKVY